MGEATLTFCVDGALKSAFADAAKPHDRTAAQHQAIAHDAWFPRQVQIGLNSATAGHLIFDDDVEVEAQAWQEETLRPTADQA